jgi:cytochrome c2
MCQNCHSIEIGINKVGPSLWSVVGREPASVPDFSYSKAMKANNLAWTAVALNAYLSDPRGDVHGAKAFQGIAGVQGSRRRHRLFDNLENRPRELAVERPQQQTV